MKKLILSVAVLAAVASCTKNETVSVPQNNEIGFSSLNDRVTKAANDAGASTDFRVFAAKEGASAWSIADYVTGGAAAATAPVAGPYYWPTDGSDMTFYAYAPYLATGANTVVESDVTFGNVDLKYVVPAGAQEDFTVATPVVCAPDADNKYVDAVALTFKHMLAKVTVKVDLADDFAKNNYISDGSDSSLPTDAAFTATITALKNALTVDATADVPAPTTLADADATSMVYDGVQSYYIAPQAFENCKLQINGITVRDIATNSVMFGAADDSADANKGVDMKELTFAGTELGATAAAFEAGKHYVLTVTISGSSTTEDGETLPEILFTATTADWSADVVGGLTQE